MTAPLFFVLWLALAIVAGLSGQVDGLRPPVPQIILLGLTAGLIALERRARWLRDWVAGIGTRTLVALHLTRFIGILFLVMGQRNELNNAWAIPSGWGDIAVASLAGVLLVTGADPGGNRRALYRIWNGLGLLDLAFVVINAARLAFEDPFSMQTLLRWPLSLVVTFLVPILLATHVWLFRRLTASPKA
ncbi:MAG TPA: hypothetical protein VFU23_02150 [Gemmatimonadales bacterium]|nr:hypothetical protein [Gemmatimonadales bacterium]